MTRIPLFNTQTDPVEAAIAWVTAMHKAQLDFHWEDCAHDVANAQGAIFTCEEADLVEEALAQVFAVIDPFLVSLDLINGGDLA